MDEQRLIRALRRGPPFATAYVARPLPLVERPAAGWGLRRMILLLALVALLLAASIVGSMLGGLFRTAATPAAVVVRDRGEGVSYTISIVHRDGREETVFPQAPGVPHLIDDFAWSPNGEELAFAAGIKVMQKDELRLYVMRPDGSGLRRILRLGDTITCPWSRASYMRWAPDGAQIAVCVIKGSLSGTLRPQLLAVDVPSGDTQVLVTGDGASEFFGPFQWSPDSAWIAYRLQLSGNALWAVRRDGSDSRQLATPVEAAGPQIAGFAWNPDSDAVAFGDNRAGAAAVRIVGLDGTVRVVIPDALIPDGTVPQVLSWNREQGLIYLSASGRIVATTSEDGTDSEVLLAWSRAGLPPWQMDDGQIDWSRVPWISADGRLQWWQSTGEGTCLMDVEDAAIGRPSFCVEVDSALGMDAAVLGVTQHR